MFLLNTRVPTKISKQPRGWDPEKGLTPSSTAHPREHSEGGGAPESRYRGIWSEPRSFQKMVPASPGFPGRSGASGEEQR